MIGNLLKVMTTHTVHIVLLLYYHQYCSVSGYSKYYISPFVYMPTVPVVGVEGPWGYLNKHLPSIDLL